MKALGALRGGTGLVRQLHGQQGKRDSPEMSRVKVIQCFASLAEWREGPHFSQADCSHRSLMFSSSVRLFLIFSGEQILHGSHMLLNT